jgi:Cof subfamily protein (haloacid dehalogenase superfamily)
MASGAPRRRIRLLLSDVDGTLVTKRKALLDSTIGAVQRLGEAGIRFAITSSRPPQGLMHLVAPLNITTPISGFNGGLITDPHCKELRRTGLCRESAQGAVALLRERRVDAWLFHGNEWLVTDPAGAYVAHEQMTLRYAPVAVDDFGPYLGGAIKIVGSSARADYLKETEALMRQRLGDGASISRSQAYYLDVTHADANKGTAVIALAEIYGIEPSEIATIGDMENDCRMFEKSGFSIAMGNATPAVKARANVVTGSNDDGGWADAMERYVLPLAP